MRRSQVCLSLWQHLSLSHQKAEQTVIGFSQKTFGGWKMKDFFHVARGNFSKIRIIKIKSILIVFNLILSNQILLFKCYQSQDSMEVVGVVPFVTSQNRLRWDFRSLFGLD